MEQRKAVSDQTRDRILSAARKLLLSSDLSKFTMDAVARTADVSRLTIYYQFDSKSKLLEALYDYIARRGHMEELAQVFRQNDGVSMLHEFIDVFAHFWDSDRDVIRRLNALGAIDSEIGKGLLARNERRRKGLTVIVERYCQWYPLVSSEVPRAIDTLHMLTSFETFDALSGSGRSREEIVAIIRKLAHEAIGFTPKPFPR
jgi:AcrR family transcriptional regulator